MLITRTWATLGILAACATCGGKATHGRTSRGDGETPITDKPSALQKRLASMTPQTPLAASDQQKKLSARVDQYFRSHQSARLFVHTDKPLYQPGQAIWFRVWQLATPSLAAQAQGWMNVQLISPKGAPVLSKRLTAQNATASNDFELPASVQGGEYTLRVKSSSGATVDRTVVVSTYQPPQIKKKLEFLRKAYGPGDPVSAALALHRGTGEALANKKVRAVINLDGSEIARLPVSTDGAGNAMVKFSLPSTIARGDGLLTILVDDGGITESIQKRIPITVKSLAFSMYAEGGDLIDGLPGRVYFSAKNTIGKPADIEGRVVDGAGRTVSRIRSFHNGLGRFELTPRAGAQYHVQITKPAGVEQTYPLPSTKSDGCSLQGVDDHRNARQDVRFGIWCTSNRSVIATAVLREKRLGDMRVEIVAGAPSVVSVPVPAGSQGAVRFTLFSSKLVPLAERLVYRNLGSDLKVRVAARRKSYSPRDKVTLEIETVDLAGNAVAADVSLAVVDDSVLSFADDKKSHLLAALYLESEMPGQEIEEPNYYFAGKKRSAQGIDLVMGTHGWRRFEWQPVLNPQPVVVSGTTATGRFDFGGEAGLPPPPAAAAPMKKGKFALKAPRAQPAMVANEKEEEKAMEPRQALARRGRGRGRELRNAERVLADKPWFGENDDKAMGWAPTRVFPAPTYKAGYDGPRTDFRETIFWAPQVKTSDNGKAEVSFFLSDSITSFRATAQGVSDGGLPGLGQTLVQSKLPVSLAVKMPNEVSAGDTIRLPITISNETGRKQTARIESFFGAAFEQKGDLPRALVLEPKERKSMFAVLKVVGNGKHADDGVASIALEAASLKDEVKRTLKVVPLGFPQDVSLAGTLDGRVRHEVNLAGALNGTIDGTITMYPSPMATMMKGMDSMIREPSGCFEQASSANYPNIMVLSYMEQNDAVDPALVQKTMGKLDRGYKKITGYESAKKGFEWFGGDPGHEALTAYGLLEFDDMSKVYGSVDKGMVKRTQAWLKSRRDGKGGYKRNKRALDSFGAASPEVTNGYITYALSETAAGGLGKELGYQKQIAKTTRDPYLMALATNTLVSLEPAAPATATAVAKLVKMQGKDGSFKGANHSITRSGGQALDIETTALAAMAMLKRGRNNIALAKKSVEWLNKQRSGYGGYGSTQSTILALKALGNYADASRVTEASGVAKVFINGKKAGELSFEKGHKGALEFKDVAALLKPGKNVIELELDSAMKLPYSVALAYRSRKPASSKETVVRVTTRLNKATAPMGEAVRMNVNLENVTDKGQPMTMARIGIPGGLRFQTWQLKELREKGLIDFYETRAREVVLYFRSLPPKAKKSINIELLATVPGTYVGPASRAYLYYTDEHKHWVAPSKIRVTRK